MIVSHRSWLAAARHWLSQRLHRLQHVLWERGMAPEPGVGYSGCPRCELEIDRSPDLQALFYPSSYPESPASSTA